MPFGVETIAVSSHSGCFSGTRFWKNDDPVAPCGKRWSMNGAAANGPKMGIRNRFVIVDEVQLGFAALRKEDLVRVADRHLVAGGFNDDALCVVPFGHADDCIYIEPTGRYASV